ncbi:gstB [Symbiodinium microadriaticum]|nr:gstB [Symbiodinium microadriaticum]
MKIQEQYDPDKVEWHHIQEPVDETGYLVDYQYSILGYDYDTGRLDMMMRFKPGQGHCERHRHVASTTTLILQGEQHLTEPDGKGGTKQVIRKAGDYALTGPDAVPHLEKGGPDGCTLLLSLHAPDGILFEIIDENFNKILDITHCKLFEFPGSRSDRVRWALHETVGDGFEAEFVDLYAADHYGEEFSRLNPNRNVPLLQLTFEDGSIRYMGESAAIIGFLADGFPEKDLAPSVGLTMERSDYLHMLHFGGSWVDMILWQLRLQQDLLPEPDRDAATVTRYRQKFQDEIEPQLQTRLEANPFICGERFTAADIIMGYNVFWAMSYGFCRDDLFWRYMQRLAERPAYRKTLAVTVTGKVVSADSPTIQRILGDFA